MFCYLRFWFCFSLSWYGPFLGLTLDLFGVGLDIALIEVCSYFGFALILFSMVFGHIFILVGIGLGLILVLDGMIFGLILVLICIYTFVLSWPGVRWS